WGETKVWDTRTGHELLNFKTLAGPVSSMCFSADGQRLATASIGFDGATEQQYGEVKVWDARTGEEMLALQRLRHWVTSMCFSPNCEGLATGGITGVDPSVNLWDARSGQELRTFEGHTNLVVSVCFSADGQCLVATDKLGKTLIWDARSGQRLDEPPPKLAGFDSVRSPDGQLFAQIDGDLVRLLRSPDAEELLIRRHRTGLDLDWHT